MRRTRTLLSVFDLKPSFIGGNEAFSRELASQLDEHGWTSVMCFYREPVPPARDYLNLPNTRIEALDMRQSEAHTLRGLSSMLLRYRPEILHLHYTKFISGYPWLARAHGVNRIVFTDHTSRPARHVIHRIPLWKRVAAKMITYPITNVVSVSDYAWRCMVGAGVLPTDRIRRIYNGVNLSRVVTDSSVGANFRRAYGIPYDRTLFAQVSSVIPEKGVEDLLHAARLAVTTESRLHFVITGDGSHRTECEALTRRLGLEDHVTFTGQIVDPMASGLFAAADALCQFSRWEEAFGWAIAEAMAHSKPVLATRVGGIPELVKDGETGCLVERGDTAAMANSLIRLGANSAERQRLGLEGRRHAHRSFDLSANVTRLLGVYGIVEPQETAELCAFKKAADRS